MSDESPLYGAVNAAKSNESIWDVSESSFTVERVNGTFYSVEKSIALYENKKAKRIAETKRKADEAKRLKNSKLNEKRRNC